MHHWLAPYLLQLWLHKVSKQQTITYQHIIFSCKSDSTFTNVCSSVLKQNPLNSLKSPPSHLHQYLYYQIHPLILRLLCCSACFDLENKFNVKTICQNILYCRKSIFLDKTLFPTLTIRHLKHFKTILKRNHNKYIDRKMGNISKSL